MKSRVFFLISLLALLVAMTAASSASAQSPATEVYNPNGEVLDVIEGGGDNGVLDENDSGGCDEADGLDVDGNSVESGSAADCAENDVATVCAEADGQDGDGNAVAYGSAADCSNSTTPTVSEGELPFTGFEAGMVALAGLALLGGGFAMRRVAHRDV